MGENQNGPDMSWVKIWISLISLAFSILTLVLVNR